MRCALGVVVLTGTAFGWALWRDVPPAAALRSASVGPAPAADPSADVSAITAAVGKTPPADLALVSAPPNPEPTLRPDPTPIPESTPTPEPRPTASPTPSTEPTTPARSASVPDPVASPATPTQPPATPARSATERGNEALARLWYPWTSTLPGWVISFADSDGATWGVTSAATRTIEVHIAAAASPAAIARVIAHELGHGVDVTRNHTSDRRAWETQRGIGDDIPWWPTAGSDFASGAGDFAECFATWQTGSNSLSAFGPCTADDLVMLASMS
jgi:hypothetical protein